MMPALFLVLMLTSIYWVGATEYLINITKYISDLLTERDRILEEMILEKVKALLEDKPRDRGGQISSPTHGLRLASREYFRG